MTHVVCVMKAEAAAKRATFTWSAGPASFEPYTLDGMDYTQFKRMAEGARGKLADLIKDYLHAEENVPQATFVLAKAGYDLHESLFCLRNEEAEKVRKWLDELSRTKAVDTVEIVVDSPWALPWNVIYDEKPTKDDFLGADASADRWKPFWGLKYNLCGGAGVNPLRRTPILRDPHVLLVVDPNIRDGLPEEQRTRLAEFVESHRLQIVHTKDDFERAVQEQRPDLLYWMSHASPEALVLSDEEISPGDLLTLFGQRPTDDVRFGGLAFLNSCQTAERAGEEGSFFEAFQRAEFAGMIGTEHQTIDQFANPLGLDFLEAFLAGGETVGSVMRRLRGRVPLGLLYGTYCPPDVRVQRGDPEDNIEVTHVPRVEGVALGVAAPSEQSTEAQQESQPLPPLPDEPYRSLAYYDRKDRALFAGRDDDIERFASYLDDASTRMLVLHGESGVGKSSFLRAGAIPYLEEDCLGYHFIRDREGDDGKQSQGSVLFVRATNDLFGQLAQALWGFCAQSYEYETPLGEKISVNLPELLAEFLPPLDPSNLVPTSKGGKNWKYGPANYLQADPSLLGRILSAISGRLPFSTILVIDQGEEVFTLAETPEEQRRGHEALDMLRRTVGASGDFKVIFALRTEYYGRVIDPLRRGLHDTGSIREYLLTDFDQEDLVEVISRPTSAEPLRFSSEIPFEKYQFRYDDGLPEEIARRVTTYTSGRRRDGVLPLLQVICSHLYQRVRDRDDKVVRLADIEELGGVEGGMRKHVDAMLLRLTRENPSDKKAFKQLLTRLYLRQPDGSLTTALLPEDDLAHHWRGRQLFPKMLAAADDLRLLRVASLRIGGQDERRYVSLGHDSLSKLAAQWHDEFEKGMRTFKMAAMSLAAVGVVVLIAGFAIWGMKASSDAANNAAKLATTEKNNAATLAKAQKEAANKELKASERAKDLAQRNEETTKTLLNKTLAVQRTLSRTHYADQVKLALTYRDEHPVRMERALAGFQPDDATFEGLTRSGLTSIKPVTTENEDLRGFEWYFLKHSTLQEKRTIPTPFESYSQVVWMPDPGAILLTGEEGVDFALAPGPGVPGKTDWRSLPLPSSMALAVAFKAPRLGMVSQNKVHLFDLSSNGPRPLTPLEIPASMLSTSAYQTFTQHDIAISPDGRRVAVASRAASDEADSQRSYQTRVAVFDADNPSLVASCVDPICQGDQVATSMAFTPTGELALVTNRNGGRGQPMPVDLLILKRDGAELKPRKVEMAPAEETSTGRFSFAVLNPTGDKLALYDSNQRRIELLGVGESPGSGTTLEAPRDLASPIRVLDVGFAADAKHVVVLAVSEQEPKAPFSAIWYVVTGKYEEVDVSGPLDNGLGGVFDIEEKLPAWAAIQRDAEGPRFLWKGNEGALRAVVPDSRDPSEKLFESPGGISYGSYLRRSPSGDKVVLSTDHQTGDESFQVSRVIDLKQLKQHELVTRDEWKAIRARGSVVSDDGQYVAGENHADVRDFFCALIEGNKLKQYPLPPDLLDASIEVLGFRPKKSQLYVTKPYENALERWDLNADELTLGQTYRWEGSGRRFAALWTATADRILLAAFGTIYAWNADTGERTPRKETSAILSDIELLGDDRYLATKTKQPPEYEYQLVIWDTSDWTVACRRKLPGGLSPEKYAIHPSGSRIVSAEMPGRITFWDVGPWAEDVEIRELISFEVEGKVRNLIFSSDGQSLAWLDGTNVRVWRAPGTPKVLSDSKGDLSEPISE